MEALWIIVIIGILSSIFGKGKGQRPSNRSFSKDTFNEFKTMLNNQNKVTAPSEAKEPVMKAENLKEAVSAGLDIKEQYSRARQKSRTTQEEWTSAHGIMEQQEAARERASHRQNVKKKNEDQDPDVFVEPDSQSILNGIIWSQILEEPRSKKPYSFRKYEN